jgi:CheY-like chemotaxis protein
MTTENQKIVLMADDDAEDCMLANEAFGASGADVTFLCVDDGFKLMDFLSDRSRSKIDKLPDLILLDLNMPKMDGREALFEIRAEPAFQNIPVIILSTSQEDEDIALTMKAGANSFATKPATFGDWVEIIKSLVQCWLVA